MAIRSICIIGNGNIAWELGRAFHQAGISITGIISRNPKEGKLLADTLGSVFVDLDADDFPQADIYLLAIKDDAIRDVGEKIFRGDMRLVHTSGAVEAEALEFRENACGVIWPMQTILKNRDVDFKNTLMVVTSNDSLLEEELAQLAKKISQRVLIGTDRQRAMLHLGAVWTNNFVNHLFDIAQYLLAEENLEFKVFLPMIREHVAKLEQFTPDQLQTGPARRGDHATLGRHLKLMEDHPNWQQLYDDISDSIMQKYINT